MTSRESFAQWFDRSPDSVFTMYAPDAEWLVWQGAVEACKPWMQHLPECLKDKDGQYSALPCVCGLDEFLGDA